MTTNPESLLAVTQEDREAAADLLAEAGRPALIVRAVRSGEHDTGPTVQAFTRHRATRPAPPAQPGREEVVSKATGLKGDDVLAFLGSAFRNIDLPPLSRDDVAEIGEALDRFIARRQPAVLPSGYWGDGNTPDYVEYNTVPADLIIGHSQDVRPEAEPVAFMYEIPGANVRYAYVERRIPADGWTETPLYAHPATLPTEPASVREERLREALQTLMLAAGKLKLRADREGVLAAMKQALAALSTEEPKL